MRVLVAAVVVAATAHAVAQPAPEAIALAGTDPGFRDALEETLAPAGMSVVAAGDVPAPSLAALETASRELADRLHATATVWLIGAPTGATLVTYDREREHVLVRELPYTLPLSASQAAEAARTARTMLRSLRVTPDVDQPPPLVVDAPAIRDTVVVRERTRLAASALVGVRIGAPDADLGGAVWLSWRPDSLGVAVAGELGPSTDIMVPMFTGTVIDGAIAVLARAPLQVSPRIRVAPMLGLAVHVVRLHGELDVGGPPIRSTRVDPAARVGVAATYAVTRDLEVGVAASVDCLFARQRYETGTQQILIVPRLQTLIGAIATFRVL